MTRLNFKRRINQDCGVGMGVTTYSLLVGLFATLLVVVLVKISTVFRVVKSLITWCSRIKQLRSLPSPPRQWFWGHAAYVSCFHIRIIFLIVSPVVNPGLLSSS